MLRKLMEPKSPEEGWGQLREALARYITKKSGDRFLGEDIAHEVFLRYLDKRDQIKDPSRLQGWLFRIASNLLTDHYRAVRKKQLFQPFEKESVQAGYNACAADCLKAELQDLPESYRTLVVQAELEGISQIRLAEEHHLTYSGVKSRVQRGRRLLREGLERKYHLEADSYGNIVQCQPKPFTKPCTNC
jgi:RNA polymerase sigma-70 factor, ECF subfamily